MRTIRNKSRVKSFPVNRANLFVLFGLTASIFLVGTVFAAEEYPSRPVTIYSGMSPGAAAGVSAQIFCDAVQKYLAKPQPFLVNFKPGANGMVAFDFFMKQPTDGYTLFWLTPENTLSMAKDPQKFSYSLKDVHFIGTLAYSPFVMAVKKDSPYKTFEDFVDFARKNPGDFSIGLTGIGAQNHLVAELLMMKLGIKLTLAPFAGGAPAVVALLGGHISCYIGSIGSMSAHLKPEGMLKALVNFDSKRAPELPDVPTYKEKGLDIERVTYMVCLARKGTPKPVLDTLAKVFKQSAEEVNVKTTLVKAGFVPQYLGPEETEKKVMDDFATASVVFKKLGLAGK
jgi:tripartite-type tricarboxylate transporter receptor subunit TctC